MTAAAKRLKPFPLRRAACITTTFLLAVPPAPPLFRDSEQRSAAENHIHGGTDAAASDAAGNDAAAGAAGRSTAGEDVSATLTRNAAQPPPEAATASISVDAHGRVTALVESEAGARLADVGITGLNVRACAAGRSGRSVARSLGCCVLHSQPNAENGGA
jgi:hypothetical protein